MNGVVPCSWRNPGIYARNHGQTVAVLAVNLKGLRLLNMSYRENLSFVFHQQYGNFITRGELEKVPMFRNGEVVGAISYLDDGRIYQVCLPAKIANQLLRED